MIISNKCVHHYNYAMETNCWNRSWSIIFPLGLILWPHKNVDNMVKHKKIVKVYSIHIGRIYQKFVFYMDGIYLNYFLKLTFTLTYLWNNILALFIMFFPKNHMRILTIWWMFNKCNSIICFHLDKLTRR
jgi:hypothetical protein